MANAFNSLVVGEGIATLGIVLHRLNIGTIFQFPW